MPISETDISAFRGGLDGYMSSPDFSNVDNEEKGLYVNKYIENFATENNISSKDDVKRLSEEAANKFTEYKSLVNVERYHVPTEEFSQYFPKLELDKNTSQEDRFKKIDAWKDAAIEQATTLRPADANDIKSQVNILANDQHRVVNSENTWRVRDLVDRFAEGIIGPPLQLLGREDPHFDWLPTKPEYDSSLSSQISTGLGNMAFLAAGGILAGPEVAPWAILAYNNALFMKQGYQQEMERSGNPNLALDVAYNQIPAASLQSLGEMIIFHGLIKTPSTAQFRTKWLAATTDEAKRDILKEATTTIGKEALKGGVGGAAGFVGMDYASGLGSYMATGDEKYLKTTEQLIDSGIVGAVTGGGVGALLKPATQGKLDQHSASRIADIASNQKKVYDLLQAGKYDEVVRLANNNFIDPESGPLNKPDFLGVPATQKTSKTAEYYAQENGVVFGRKDVNKLNTFITKHEALPDGPEKQSQLEEYTRKKEALDQIKEGKFALKDSTTLEIPEDLAVGIDKLPNIHSVTLEDRNTIPEGETVIYVNRANVKEDVTRQGIQHGDISFVLNPEGKSGNFVAKDSSGNIIGRNKASSVAVSHNPKVGWTPIVIKDTGGRIDFSKATPENPIEAIWSNKDTDAPVKIVGVAGEKDGVRYLQTESGTGIPEGEVKSGNGKVTRKIEILSPVKEAIKFDKNATEAPVYQRSVKNKDDTLHSVIVKQNGKDFTVPADKGGHEFFEDAKRAGIEKTLEKHTNNIDETPSTDGNLTENDVFGAGLKNAYESFNDLKDTPPEQHGKDLLPFIEKGMNEIETKIDELNGKPDKNKFIDQLHDFWYYLSTAHDRITKKTKETVVPSEKPTIIPEPNTQVGNVNPKSIAANEGKEIIYHGVEGIIKIDGDTAVLVGKDGNEYELGNKNNNISDLEGFNDGRRRVVIQSPEHDISHEADMAVAEERLTKEADNNLDESNDYNNSEQPGVSYNLVSFKDGLVKASLDNIIISKGGKEFFGGPRREIAKDGTISRESFDSGIQGRASKEEINFLKLLVPDFFKGDRVNVRELQKKLNEIEALKVVDIGIKYKGSDKASALEHKMDTMNPNWREMYSGDMTSELRSVFQEWQIEYGKTSKNGTNAWTGRGIVDELSPKQLRGEKEVAPGVKVVKAGDLLLKVPGESKFTGGHHGKDGHNAIGFLRYYILEYQSGSKMPDGTIATKVEKIFKVQEVQSDWNAHDVKNREAAKTQEDKFPGTTSKDFSPSHPLLSHYETLMLKTAIEEARKAGANKIILPDGKSAMMTEGHDFIINKARDSINRANSDIDLYKNGASEYDRNIRWKEIADEKAASLNKQYEQSGGKFEVKDGEIVIVKEPFVGGMTQAYDKNAPSIARKLTGDKGKPVEIGVHDKALSFNENGEEKNEPPEGSPVFKDASGNPKTQNTGYEFDITTSKNSLTDNKNTEIPESSRLSESDIKQHFKDKYGKDVTVSDTNEGVRGDQSYFGKSNSETGEITLNRRYLTDLKHADEIFQHEVTHLGYNDPDLLKSVNEIVASFPDPLAEANKYIEGGYKEGESQEESVVRRVDELLDKWNQRGAFDKFVQTVKTWTKEKLGITLNDKDLQRVAARIFERGLLNAGKGIKDQKGEDFALEPNKNTEQPKVEKPKEEDTTDILGGKPQDGRKAMENNIKNLLGREIEHQTYEDLKKVPYQFLSDKDLDEYYAVVKNFIETRSKTQGADNVRLDQTELDNKITELHKKAAQGAFDYFQEEFPDEFVKDGKPSQFSDIGNDIDSLSDYVSQILDTSGGNNSIIKGYTSRREEERKVIDLQNEFKDTGRYEELKDKLFSLITPLKDLHGFVESNPKLKEISNRDPQFKLAVDRFKDLNSRVGEAFEAFGKEMVDYMVNTDPTQHENFVDVRRQKYLLLSMKTDGYFPFINSFISSSKEVILATKGIRFSPAYTKKRGIINNLIGINAKIERIAGNRESADFIYKLSSDFHDSLTRANEAIDDFLIPFTDSVKKYREKQNGSQFNDVELNKMGIYVHLMQRYLDEHPNEALSKNVNWVTDSISRYDKTNDETFNKASKYQKEFLEKLLKDVDFESPEDQRNKITENFKREMGDAALGYVEDMGQVFELTKPLAKASSEFAYGKQFNEIENYFPSFTTPVGSNHADTPSVIFDQDFTMMTPVSSIANGQKGAVNIRQSTGGMSSIKDRKRLIPNGRALVFNINNLVFNRGRLNLIDQISSIHRREMANIIDRRNKSFQEFLGDPEGKLGKADVLRAAFNQEWASMVQSSSYLGTWHAAINGFVRRFSLVKLSQLYRAPVHFLGNIAGYVIQSMGTPRRITDMFKAFSYLNEVRRNPESGEAKLVERLLFESRSRSQDVTLERSTTLNHDYEGWWQKFKGSKAATILGKIDDISQKILFAPLKYSDQSSGNAIMLSEYLNLERERSGNSNLQYKDLTWNSLSYHKAVNVMEKNVTVGRSSRRGVWLNNSNASISFLRNLLVAFAGQNLSNATNFTTAVHNLRNGGLTPTDKANSIRFMMSIAAQTATFVLVKHVINNFIGNAIMSAAGGDQSDGVEALYRKRLQDPTMSAKEKAMLEQEISTRNEIGSIFRYMREKNDSKKLLGLNLLKDMLPNMWYVSTGLQPIYDGLIHVFYDKYEEQSHQLMKQGEIERLTKLIKDGKEYGNDHQVLQAQQAMDRLKSQKALTLVGNKQGYLPYGGIIGDLASDGFRFVQDVSNSVLGTKEMDSADVAQIAGVLGYGAADFDKYLRLRKSIAEARDTGKKQLEKNLEKIKKEGKY